MILKVFVICHRNLIRKKKFLNNKKIIKLKQIHKKIIIIAFKISKLTKIKRKIIKKTMEADLIWIYNKK